MEKKITPVLLGADLNCYCVARAFHEKYGVVTEAFGRYAVGATDNSGIVNFHVVKDLDDPSTAVRVLRDFASEHGDETLILLGCTDDYAALIIDCRDQLSDKYFVPYSSRETADKLADKADFYNVCDRYGILYPKTLVTDSGFSRDEFSESSLGFRYPIIVKPSSSDDYWKHPFDGMKKVYSAQTPEEANDIVSKIYSSGYPKRMILQDMVPGDDSFMNVLTCYSGKDGRVKMACYGHVLLQEHVPKGLGNHTVILTESHPEQTAVLRNMLDDLGYVGFSNFDIKYDSRDGSYRAFEINLRQGRSNYYITAAGLNIAEFLVRDCLGEDIPYTECSAEHLWYYVPKSVIRKYVRDPELIERVRKAEKEKRATSTLWYRPDLRANPKRLAFVMAYLYNQKRKYKKYCK